MALSSALGRRFRPVTGLVLKTSSLFYAQILACLPCCAAVCLSPSNRLLSHAIPCCGVPVRSWKWWVLCAVSEVVKGCFTDCCSPVLSHKYVGDLLHHYKQQNVAGVRMLLSLPLGSHREIVSNLLLQHNHFLKHVLHIIWPRAAAILVPVRRGTAALGWHTQLWTVELAHLFLLILQSWWHQYCPPPRPAFLMGGQPIWQGWQRC